MKAIVQDRYGSPDVLELREIDRPVNGDDHVLVRVHAAGVDQGVWHEVAGLPYLFRIAGIGVRAPSAPALKNCGLRGQVGELLQRREPDQRAVVGEDADDVQGFSIRFALRKAGVGFS